ncbi:unnamed protein product [Didymodactylos carnosus]|uniref:Uncharacterized protein n=1 Tax=Didymodactylos carnosus TaxID=1234261 RepID=A0A814V2X0_9BILA|nr:unnamed protein product [Didymodactylos carnosus]CAF1201420.1 unnamed protein product [Didymodactylos carnosus]CAF3945551.1 unnamed protein product [Didymodactylos carnosus]CAF4011230.1 unnamed protein product [Didymodactylos carnosus]
MAISKPCVDISTLPSDVLTYANDKFIRLVEQLVGEDIAELFNVQAIHNIPCLLKTTSDVFEILKLDCPDIENIRDKLSFKLTDGTFIVKPGYRSSVSYVTEVFRNKFDDHLKQLRAKSRSVTVSSQLQLPLPFTQVSSSSSNQLAVSSIQLLSSSSTSPIVPPSTTITEHEHRNQTIKTIGTWCEREKESLALDELSLSIVDDYKLYINNDTENLEASIRCNCGVKLNLFKLKNRTFFQLSNFYAHLKSKKCSMMKQKKNDDKKKKSQDDSASKEEKVEEEEASDGNIASVADTTSSKAPETVVKNQKKRPLSQVVSSSLRVKRTRRR